MGNREQLAKDERGMILLLTTMLVILLASLSAVYLNLIHTGIKSISAQKDEKGALYLAEAGIQRAVLDLQPGEEVWGWRGSSWKWSTLGTSGWDWNAGYKSESLGSGSYGVEVLALHKFSGTTDMRFEVEADIDPDSTARTIYLLLTWDSATGADWNLSLYDPANGLVAQAMGDDNPETITYEASLSGTYTIRVTNQAGIPYRLLVAHPDRLEGIASNKRRFLATGTLNLLSRGVKVDINNCSGTLPDFSGSPRPDFDYLLYAGGKVIFANFDFQSVLNIKGKVQARGGTGGERSYDDIDYSQSEAGNVYIAGDAVVGDLLTIPPSFSDSDYDNYRAYAQAHGTYFKKGKDFERFVAKYRGSTISGVFYIEDDIDLDLRNKTLTVKGVIVSHNTVLSGSKKIIIEPQSFAGLPDSNLYGLVSRWDIEISGSNDPLTIESSGFLYSNRDIKVTVSKGQEVNINARLVANNNIEMTHQLGGKKTGTIVMYDGANIETEVGRWEEYTPPTNQEKGNIKY